MPGFFEGLGQIVEGYNGTREVSQYVMMSRDDATQALLRNKVSVLSRSDLEDFQHRFAQFSCAIMNPEKRVRAMELYAMIHLLAFNYYQGDFLGFFTDGQPLS
jgi:hypothetical protein